MFFLGHSIDTGIQQMLTDNNLLFDFENSDIIKKNNLKMIENYNIFFRSYQWLEPTVSLGRFQKEETINSNFCKKNNIPIVKRPTGGKALFHYNDFSISFVFRNHQKLNISEYYKIAGNIIYKTLKKLELSVELKETTEKPENKKTNICFAYSINFEITAKQKKLVGLAQRQTNDNVLVQATIPIEIDFNLYSAIFRQDINLLKQKICALNDLTSKKIQIDMLIETLKDTCANF